MILLQKIVVGLGAALGRGLLVTLLVLCGAALLTFMFLYSEIAELASARADRRMDSAAARRTAQRLCTHA